MFIILQLLLSYSEKKRHVGLFWFMYCGALVFGAYYLINLASADLSLRLFLLFYFIYPLLNAPLDWLSLNITRGLLHSIRDQHHSGWQAFAWALFDLLLALLFLLMVSAVLVVGMAVADNITGKIMLQTLFIEIKQPETAINYIWIYPMLLTTLVPTLIHFALAGASLIMWLPQSWRHRIADNVDKNYYKLWAATVYLSITPVIGLAAPIALLYGLYYLLMAQGGWLQTVLLQWAELLAQLFE